MTQHDLLHLLEEGVENGKLSPSLAAFIAADVLGVAPDEADYAGWRADPLNEADDQASSVAALV